MTVKILRSRIAPDFEVVVAHHAAELRAWKEHMARVAADDKKNVTGIERHVAYPRPAADQLVEHAINENDVPDYQILEDGPTPAETLRLKKIELLHAVSVAESSAIEMVAPFSKLRGYNFRESDILGADAARLEQMKPGLLKKVAATVGLYSVPDVSAELEKVRPTSDTQHLKDQVSRRQNIEALRRAGAKMHSDIEDLTLDNIDAWKMPDFPK